MTYTEAKAKMEEMVRQFEAKADAAIREGRIKPENRNAFVLGALKVELTYAYRGE